MVVKKSVRKPPAQFSTIRAKYARDIAPPDIRLLRKSLSTAGKPASQPAKSGKPKKASGQREMLMAISGKGQAKSKGAAKGDEAPYPSAQDRVIQHSAYQNPRLAVVETLPSPTCRMIYPPLRYPL
jgi:hypothetical protein